MRLKRSVPMLTLLAAFFLGPAVAEKEVRRFSNADERTVAALVEASPHDYIGAVVEVSAACTVQCEGHCLDRVRIVELIAQAPAPAPQLTVGSEFHLLSGAEKPSEPAGPALRLLVLVRPFALPDCQEKGYGAALMEPPDPASMESIRRAFEVVLAR